MTAGSYCYIGPQGIVHGTTLTLMNAGRKYLGVEKSDLGGKTFVTAGLGGMSGAQAKAAVIAGCVAVIAEVSETAIDKRHGQGWVEEKAADLDDCIARIADAKAAKRATSIAYHGNVVDLWERLAAEGVDIDLGSDQTSCHDPFGGGYYPVQLSTNEANAMMTEDPAQYKALVQESLLRQVAAIDSLSDRGMQFWDYGNSFLLEVVEPWGLISTASHAFLRPCADLLPPAGRALFFFFSFFFFFFCSSPTRVYTYRVLSQWRLRSGRRRAYGCFFVPDSRLQASRAGADLRDESGGEGFRYPSYVQDIMGDIFSLGFGPFRWVCTGGEADLIETDKIAAEVMCELHDACNVEEEYGALALQHFQDNHRWIVEAPEHKLVVGSQARILYANAEARMELATRFNAAVASGRISAPVALSRDHHDVSGVDSPWRETSNVTDGSMFTADMAIQNVIGDSFRGATWVAIHNGYS